MQTYKLLIAYDGTDYAGWQRQPAKRTIQGAIEEALARIASKQISVIAAGRTDAGVHALGQVTHFRANLRLGDEELFRALNGNLPPDIRIISLKKAKPDFHARKHAVSKVYQYRIFNARPISPFLLRYVHHWPSSLDVAAMKKASVCFRRVGDFTSFSSGRYPNPVRHVMRSQLVKKDDEILYTIKADGFLRYMVRTIVGTLLEVGKGKMPSEKIENIFAQKKRTQETPTAPAKGLCLIKVNYHL